MKIVGSAALFLLAVLTTGCGPQLVAEGLPAAEPYDGPLHVEITDPDHEDPAVRSGAAGRALECAGEMNDGGTGRNAGVSAGHDSPAEALAGLVEDDLWRIPTHGYRIERDDGNRVLYSYDVAGRTKIAVIVADQMKDYDGHAGWGAETFARCDPAELPDPVTDELGIQVWTDRKGQQVPVAVLSSGPGPEHCDWDSATFLHLKEDEYIRDPEGALYPEILDTPFNPDTTLPDDATNTGYALDGQRLWLAADKSAAFIVIGNKVERWPAPTEEFGCA